MESVFLYQVDAEKGEGVELAKEFKVRAYPSFILLNGDGETLDRWVGYSKDMHLETLDAALSDLTTIEHKMERYNSKPSAKDAAVLGRYSYALGEYKDAVNYYTTAQKLNDNPETDYSYKIFDNTYSGVKGEHFTFDDVTAAADNVLKSEAAKPKIKGITAMRVTRMAKRQDRLDIIEPYIEAGLKMVSGSDDPDDIESYNDLMVEKSLYVTRDKKAAVKYKKANLPDGWMEDAGKLNGFAWWCFENLVNLEEAEQLARKGVELAEPGREKAMILDTLAEICNVLDNCFEAVKFTKLAISEDPENEFYGNQLERFEKILASAE